MPDVPLQFGCITGDTRINLPGTIVSPLIAVIALISSVTLILVKPVLAQTPRPATLSGVFDPDTADLTPAGKQAVTDAANKLKPAGDCYPPPGATFSAQGPGGDQTFADIVGQARAAALQQALAALGYDQSQVKAGYVQGTSDDVQVSYNKPDEDKDAPKLKVTSAPPKGTRVKAGDKIQVTITASERDADGHKSWPTGVQMIQLVADDGLVESKQYGRPPQPCLRQTVAVSYTVPKNPPAIIHLHALAEDGAGNQSGEDGEFPTTGDYFGTLVFTSQQQVPSGMQYFNGRFDILLKRDGNGNLNGTLSGSQSEKLAIARCPSDTITPGRVTAKLNGILKGTTISLDVSDGTFTPPDMVPCFGRQPGKPPGVYTWPHFAQIFHELQPAQTGSYSFDREWTNAGGGYPYTEHYTLKLDPAK